MAYTTRNIHLKLQNNNSSLLAGKVALVTGAAKRLGAEDARALHAAGANVVIHYHHSADEADALSLELNQQREHSAATVCTQLGTKAQAEYCVQQAIENWGRLDIVVNNASSFFPTPMGTIEEAQFQNLIASNLAAPLFVTQAAMPELKRSEGCVINMVDIHGLRPHAEHSAYSSAKAGLIMLTKSLAKELAPQVRVNAIAPGAILWPEDGQLDAAAIAAKTANIPLQRSGTPQDIANLVVYLSSSLAQYVTGEIIKVDGGSSL